MISVVAMNSLGSDSKHVMARLALTSRYNIQQPDVAIGRHLSSDEWSHTCAEMVAAHQQAAQQKEGCTSAYASRSTIRHASVDGSLTQIIICKLEGIHCSVSCTQAEAVWQRGDELESSVKAAIKRHPLYQPSLHDKRHLTVSLGGHDHSLGNPSDSKLAVGLARLLDAQKLTRLLTMPSNLAIRRHEQLRDQRTSNMKERSKCANICQQTMEAVGGSALDALLISNSGDFPPIYLGKPLALPDWGCTVITDLSSDLTTDLLYLQLMLKSDKFFVQCTGPKHIVGRLIL